ncbi:MAG TPA: RNA polymerase sigma factor [Armatimonadota bacterium]|jgi:RNA polymerase sigma-70 factor (ECF subfamily)
MADVHDEALILRCLQQDEVAFSELMHRYQNGLYRLAYHWAGNRDDAQDLCQECFIHLYKVLPKYDSRYRFSVWLYRVATNHCINWLKANQRNRAVLSLNHLAMEGGEPPDPVPTLEQRMIRSEERQTVMAAVGSLPDRYRMPVLLRYLEDFSYKEIAAILGITVKNVEIRLHRSKAMLAERLQRVQQEGEPA